MASYAGPATIVSFDGEIEVTVDLRSKTSADGAATWVGYVEHSDQDALSCAAISVGQYGLTIRLPDGREGQFMPIADLGQSTGGIDVSGFMRW
jgi:hypothetical protein